MKNIPELLAPVGDFECLKAAVQNGADCVYLGASNFNARNSATNFSQDGLKQAIEYAKLRNVKINFTLNILIKEHEFEDAIELARVAYNMGIDAVIVQDLGLAQEIVKCIPQLPVHASTQMTVHNLEGVKQLENIGVKRVILARELPINEIEYITKNCNIETEVFVHGALCICYSGQCLFSSLVGGRSGNRGMCAQPCRLPYKLYNEENKIKEGYLLSPRDLCALEYLPRLVNAGVKSFKLEGRLKSPEYVATVTRIYRKYLDMALENNAQNSTYKIDSQDKTELMQVFNRGGFSSGHLNTEPNNELIYDKKSNNMGLSLGKIIQYNPNKGYIKVKLENNVALGDRISIEANSKNVGKAEKANINSTYTISELLINNKNVPKAESGNIVTLGRMKGDILINSKVYKISSKELQTKAKNSYNGENKRIPVDCGIEALIGKPIKFNIYRPFNIEIVSNFIPEKAENNPTRRERIIQQLSKTKNTPYDFNFNKINIEENIHITSIAELNELRRSAINKLEVYIKQSYTRNLKHIELEQTNVNYNTNFSISVLLNELNEKLDYTSLQAENIYIPLKYFENTQYKSVLQKICSKFKVYIYMPTISRNINKNKAVNGIKNILSSYNISGFVVSNIGQIAELKQYNKILIGNYTLNIYNHHTISSLEKLGINTFTISPELDSESIEDLLNNATNTEIIVYGKIPVMFSNYCLFGNTNKCTDKCGKQCQKGNFYLQDRYGFKFQVKADKAISTIFNSRAIDLLEKKYKVNVARFDITDETIEEINELIKRL